MGSSNGTDKVDAAIAAVESPQPPSAQEMIEFPIRIASTGRLVMLAVPPDLTDAEAIEWAAWFLGTLVPGLRARRPASRIIVPGRA